MDFVSNSRLQMTASSVPPRLLVLCLLVVTSAAVMEWKNPESVDTAHRLTLKDSIEWHKKEPSALIVTYDTERLSEKLTLNLYGYTERNASRISKKKTPFTKLASAKVPDPGLGEVDVLKLDLKCVGSKPDCNKFDMGYVEVTGEKTDNVTYVVHFISQIVPLGWFLQKNFADTFKEWAFGKCNQWHKSESEELEAVINKGTCPSSLDEAESDPGWFIKSYYLAGYPTNQRLNGNSTATPKQICFYSSVEKVPSTMHAAPASMCCYRTHDKELLHKEFMSGKVPLAHGSSVLRSHPFGSDVHEDHFISGQVPYLSHWYWDIMPFFYCCYWWEGHACVNLYLSKRPAPKVAAKPTGSKATHIYNSHVYQFGKSAPILCPEVGEYWLIKHPAIEVQIRSYVVSAYLGNNPPSTFHKSQFAPASSKTAFFNGLAMRSMEDPDRIVEMVSPEGEYRTYVQATDLKSKVTIMYDGRMGRGYGANILIGEATYDVDKIVPILVKNGTNRVGMYAYVANPGEEFFNLYVSITSELAAGFTGLLAGGSCAENKVMDAEDRLFSSLCDNCDDFKKYRDGRPLFFVPVNSDSYEEISKHEDISGVNCNGDPACKYITWSTMYQPYYDSSVHSLNENIKPLLPKIDSNVGFATCDKPDIKALYVGPEQSFRKGAAYFLNCMPPFGQSSQSKSVTCVDSGGKLTFDGVDGFTCEPKKEVVQQEEQAAEQDKKYSHDNYTPKPPATTSKQADDKKEEQSRSACLRALCLQTLLASVAIGHFILSRLMASAPQ